MPGWIDGLDCYEVRGWSVTDEGTSDRVAICVDGKEVAQVACDLPRPDVQAAGFSTGDSGFRFLFPDCDLAGRPRRVSVRSLSLGQDLPHTPACLDGLTATEDGPLVPVLLSPAQFATDAYATDAAFVAQSDQDPTCLTLCGRVLAPPDAVLDVVLADGTGGRLVGPLEVTDIANPRIPAGAPNLREIRLTYAPPAEPGQHYAAFHVRDLNPASPHRGRSPVSPVASFCIPLGYDWLTEPSPESIARTCGGAAWENFGLTGVSGAYLMKSLARTHLGDRPLTILDWGVGCGRLALPLQRGIMPESRVIGVDVDRVNVEWCRQHAPDISVSLSDFYPPLAIESESVDMIYGVSVMTHLTEGAQMAWLKELRRILKIGGVCVLTTHGEYALAIVNMNDPVMMRQLGTLGISDGLVDPNLGPKLELKQYYRATFQFRRQVEAQWSTFFKLAAYYPAGMQAFQDIVVLRKE